LRHCGNERQPRVPKYQELHAKWLHQQVSCICITIFYAFHRPKQQQPNTQKNLLFKHRGQNCCFFTGPPPELGFSAQLTVSRCQLRGLNGYFYAINWHVLPFLYAKKAYKAGKIQLELDRAMRFKKVPGHHAKTRMATSLVTK
jgi:hypothetical protein